jgi:purine-nucleoside phosphorylase
MKIADNEAALARLRDWRADTAIVLGSGLSEIVSREPDSETIAYAKFGEIPPPSVPGHAGQFVLGRIDKVPVIFAQGRVHLYEGHSARQVTSIVRVLAQSAVKQVILTNAAGSANPEFAPGSWMMITDHLNLTGTSPLLGAAQFIDLTEAYSKRLQTLFAAAAGKTGVGLHQGVYAGLLGPQYETPAEVRMLQKLGADAVGMSTVLETIQLRALGLEVAAFSCLTNFAAGLSSTEVSHEEVLVTGKEAAASFSRLLSAALPDL